MVASARISALAGILGLVLVIPALFFEASNVSLRASRGRGKSKCDS